MRKVTSTVLPALFFFTSCSIEQTDISTRTAATRAAIARGEAATFLKEMEAKALEAEKKQDWHLALVFYRDAGSAAGFSGQLQKAVSYRTREFELAQIMQDLQRQALAVDGLEIGRAHV